MAPVSGLTLTPIEPQNNVVGDCRAYAAAGDNTAIPQSIATTFSLIETLRADGFAVSGVL